MNSNVQKYLHIKSGVVETVKQCFIILKRDKNEVYVPWSGILAFKVRYLFGLCYLVECKSVENDECLCKVRIETNGCYFMLIILQLICIFFWNANYITVTLVNAIIQEISTRLMVTWIWTHKNYYLSSLKHLLKYVNSKS